MAKLINNLRHKQKQCLLRQGELFWLQQEKVSACEKRKKSEAPDVAQDEAKNL